MTQKTTLKLYGLPGRTQSFVAKTEYVFAGDEYAFTLYIDQSRSFNLYIDQEKEFTLER